MRAPCSGPWTGSPRATRVARSPCRASRIFVEVAFRYVDAISVQVVNEYESERVRWLANSNSVRRATLSDLLVGTVRDVSAAEASLGYRLRQHHVAVVLWLDREGTPDDLRSLEHLLVRLAKEFGISRHCLFVPQDRSTGWGWLPFGRETQRSSVIGEEMLETLASIGARVAIGGPAVGIEGFRATHLEATRAQELALASREHARPVTSWTDPDVRAASLLLHDLDATRRLVEGSLGTLATADEGNALLRRTLRTFLAQGSSYSTAASLLHLHKNTVRYRVEKAVQARGRPIDDDRLGLELALIACEWLGASVLT